MLIFFYKSLRYVGNIHFTVKTMYHILQNVRNSLSEYYSWLWMISIQLACFSLYYNCTARKRVKERFAQEI